MADIIVEDTPKQGRYLINFDTDTLPCEFYDVVIVGSGIAGVYTALSTPRQARVLIITKETIEINNSVLAQGGIAVISASSGGLRLDKIKTYSPRFKL